MGNLETEGVEIEGAGEDRLAESRGGNFGKL